MSDMPESAERLLFALVEIEDKAIAVARMGGCQCDQPLPVPHADRTYPACRFDYAKSVGRPYDQIIWELAHQPGCPMEGQRGTGCETDLCSALSPESQLPCYLLPGHKGAHEARRGPTSISSWA